MVKKTNKELKTSAQAYKDCVANRDRINIYFPKGTKERIENLGYTPSEYIKMLVLRDLLKQESLKNNNGFDYFLNNEFND